MNYSIFVRFQVANDKLKVNYARVDFERMDVVNQLREERQLENEWKLATLED